MIKTRILIPVLLVVAVALLIAFGILTVVGGSESVAGQVIKVEQASLTTIASLTIEDASGKEWTFQGTGTFSGLTPTHLNEHGALREKVTVEYEKTDSGDLLILEISD
jgi:sulfite exporter TauE/SafE